MNTKTQNTQNTKDNIFNILYILSLPIAIVLYTINYL